MRRELRDGNTYRVYVEQFEQLNLKIRELGQTLKPYGGKLSIQTLWIKNKSF